MNLIIHCVFPTVVPIDVVVVGEKRMDTGGVLVGRYGGNRSFESVGLNGRILLK